MRHLARCSNIRSLSAQRLFSSISSTRSMLAGRWPSKAVASTGSISSLNKTNASSSLWKAASLAQQKAFQSTSTSVSKVEEEEKQENQEQEKTHHAVVSTFDLFSIGIGPSSSHTVGPMRAARIFVATIKADLYGSLALTGIGHGTPNATLMGLEGEAPETVPTDTVISRVQSMHDTNTITLNGTHRIRFNPEKDLTLHYYESLPQHPNGMRFSVFDKNGDLLATNEYFSIGGGFVVNERTQVAHGENVYYRDERETAVKASGSEGGDRQSQDLIVAALPFTNGNDLLHLCHSENLTMAEVVFLNELQWRSRDDVIKSAYKLWEVMDDSIRNGCLSSEEYLPGGLNVKRRAPGLYKNLLRGIYKTSGHYHSSEQQAPGSGSSRSSNLVKDLNETDSAEPHTQVQTNSQASLFKNNGDLMAKRSQLGDLLKQRTTSPRRGVLPQLDYLSVYAIAVNEENAAGGRVVTAPTNGSAGVIPSVLKYHLEFLSENPARDILEFLFTTAAIGMLFKRGASISAAEMGCQGEVGVACAMAAAGFAAVMGGTARQIENAAEIGMEHNLGLTCDPIHGLVQIPCIERNALGAVKAVTAAQLALQGDGSHRVTLDQVIETMRQTGHDMMSKYKETSQGGLAVNVPLHSKEMVSESSQNEPKSGSTKYDINLGNLTLGSSLKKLDKNKLLDSDSDGVFKPDSGIGDNTNDDHASVSGKASTVSKSDQGPDNGVASIAGPSAMDMDSTDDEISDTDMILNSTRSLLKDALQERGNSFQSLSSSSKSMFSKISQINNNNNDDDSDSDIPENTYEAPFALRYDSNTGTFDLDEDGQMLDMGQDELQNIDSDILNFPQFDSLPVSGIPFDEDPDPGSVTPFGEKSSSSTGGRRAEINDGLGAVATIGAQELYNGHIQAIKRQRLLEKRAGKAKDSGFDRNANQHGMVVKGQRENVSTSLVSKPKSSRPLPQPKINTYTMPPSTGQFIISSISEKRCLYFPKRKIDDIKKQRNRIMELTENMHSKSSRINHIVSQIEKTLDFQDDTQDGFGNPYSLGHTQDSLTQVADYNGDTNATDSSEKDSSTLWVDKYRPKTFIDLLRNDVVNREVLRWIKAWDYCVFKNKSSSGKGANLKRAHNEAATSRTNYFNPNYSDKLCRPERRILLISGPPGLGKTTLVHVLAAQAGYRPTEINASDDRTSARAKDRITAITQTHSIASDSKPQLLVIDEIDGAHGSSSASDSNQGLISVLVKMASHSNDKSSDKNDDYSKAKSRPEKGLLRPIICICNDMYAPVLRPLRQVAQCFQLHPPPPSQLVPKLQHICDAEGLKADTWTLMALAEMSECDIRSCINTLQFIRTQTEHLTVDQLHKSQAGQKDVQRSLFVIWNKIFTLPKYYHGNSKRSLRYHNSKADTGSKSLSSFASKRSADGSSSSAATSRIEQQFYINELVQDIRSFGDIDKIMQGCFENYLNLGVRDLTYTKISDLCRDWFAFYDYIDLKISRKPSIASTLWDYLNYSIVAVHKVCSTPYGLTTNMFTYPNSSFEMYTKIQATKNITLSMLQGASDPRALLTWSPHSAATDLLCWLVRILSTNLVTVNHSLLKGDELARFERLVSILVDWGLNFVQSRADNGQFTFTLDPPVDRLTCFTSVSPPVKLLAYRYATRQMISQSVSLQKIIRSKNSDPKAERQSATMDSVSNDKKKTQSQDYLEKLMKPVAPKAISTAIHKPARDFFGRIIEDQSSKNTSKSDSIATKKQKYKGLSHNESTINSADKASDTNVWFYYNEGYSNAVRHLATMEDLF
ncbi:hypothetical protein H4219_001078 [Mycoemilia scoparia]|uniref:AAA+ ATPase domain-containing protein n=1 Tax=Mycoemilia scoparia TaxID=417184 RepID=A0A9W8AAI8_9FUNG|nr:hypothetical protein H4219_001078 [Mycoemilia scoparia]